MAGLSYKIIFFFILLVFIPCAGAFESSFPFPFEFGHSSDIYLDVKKETKEQRKASEQAKELLIQRGIKNDPKSIIKYIKTNDTGAIRLLLEAGYDPNSDINANFPLYYAAKYDKKEIARLLLQKGADPNKDFTSPLRYAILHKNYDFASILIEKGADINYTDMLTGETVLYTAIKKNELDIAALLLNKGAKIDSRSYKAIKAKNLERKLGITLN